MTGPSLEVATVLTCTKSDNPDGPTVIGSVLVGTTTGDGEAGVPAGEALLVLHEE